MDSETAENLADTALDRAQKLGAAYADVRVYVQDRNESVSVKNDVVESANIGSDSGVGVRVLKNGAWGFASFADLSRPKAACRKEILKLVRDAIDLAEASARLRSFPLELAPMSDDVPVMAQYETPSRSDPFSVPVKEKVELLRELCAMLGRGNDKIAIRAAEIDASSFTKVFASFEADAQYRRFLTQTFRSCGLELSVLGVDGNEVQERSVSHRNASGFDWIFGLDGKAIAQRLTEEALELLSADECEPGVSDIVIMPEHLGLHVHETGHGFEGDRLLGYEQTYVGGTFINEIVNQIGSYEFGSEAVSIVADATSPEGYGTFAFDDEGVPGQRFYLVERGIIKNVLTSRETVAQINRRMGRPYFEASNGTMRASSYTRMPLIRMTNISLEPGSGTLADLVARVERGILLDGTQSWSMSEDRKNFDFGMQYGREILGGKIGRVVRNAGYTGSNLAFWKSCEAVAGDGALYMLNVPNCGKGMPGQTMRTGHRSAPALFRGVHVFNRKQRGGA